MPRPPLLLAPPSARFAGVLAGFAAFGLFAVTLAPARRADAASDAGPADVAVAAKGEAFVTKSNAFFNTYCNKCHNSDKSAGGVPLDVYKTIGDARKDRKMWETISRVVSNGEMPPKAKPQPSAALKAEFLTAIEDTLIKVDCVGGSRDPGRVTLRRLNRAEYNNTVRDLCGIDFKPADDFPSDDVGYGFDNIGDVLSLPPILLEKYLTAADHVLDQAVAGPVKVAVAKQSFGPHELVARPRGSRGQIDGKTKIQLKAEGAALVEKFNFPAAGEYVIRVKAYGFPEGGEAPKLVVRLDGKDQKTFTIDAPEAKAETVEVKVTVAEGEHKPAAAFVNPSDPKKLPEGTKPRTLGVSRIEIEGPVGGSEKPAPDSTKLVLGELPKSSADNRKAAEVALTKFVRRAYRRPAKPSEIARLLKLYDSMVKDGEPFVSAMKLPLKAVLVSPHFLFRVELDPNSADGTKLISEHELASRLSYFLWSSMPDETLLAAADKGELRKPGQLKTQVERMLRDPRARSLVDNFAGQWLQLRSVRNVTPDTSIFKDFDDSLKSAIVRESEMFFEYILKNDRSVLEFLDADYTFLNDRLSSHYGVPGVQGPEFRYVKLKDTARGGIVTQASVLTVTSNPSRTSPVKRGKWIYENVLGLQPPPVPPDVPELPAGKLEGTLRQQMEQHRSNPSCAGCHAKLDPLGFGLENFDATGRFRSQDNKINIDASGVLPDGEKFDGPAELRKILLGKADMFRRCLAEKLLTYGTGRGLEYYDKCVLDEISLKSKSGGDKFSVLIQAVVECDAFQKRKGKRSE